MRSTSVSPVKTPVRVFRWPRRKRVGRERAIRSYKLFNLVNPPPTHHDRRTKADLSRARLADVGFLINFLKGYIDGPRCHSLRIRPTPRILWLGTLRPGVIIQKVWGMV